MGHARAAADKAELQPLAACIVQNQEELRIPLLLEPLPPWAGLLQEV